MKLDGIFYMLYERYPENSPSINTDGRLCRLSWTNGWSSGQRASQRRLNAFLRSQYSPAASISPSTARLCLLDWTGLAQLRCLLRAHLSRSSDRHRRRADQNTRDSRSHSHPGIDCIRYCAKDAEARPEQPWHTCGCSGLCTPPGCTPILLSPAKDSAGGARIGTQWVIRRHIH